MKFKFKKTMFIISITTLVGLVTGCSNNEKKENSNTTQQQEQQIDKNESQIDNNKDKNELQIDNSKDQNQSQIVKTISEDEALEICKNKLIGIWSPDFLKLGTDKSGIDKIVSIEGKKYYAIYHIDQKEDIVADFRFLVDQSSGELFYQSPEDLKKLTSIDEYISKFKKNNSSTNNNTNEFTTKKAIELTLKYINEPINEKGDMYAVSDKFSIMVKSSDKPMVKNDESYYPIELYMPNKEGKYDLCGQWYISSNGKLYYSNGSLGESVNDISDKLVNKIKWWI